MINLLNQIVPLYMRKKQIDILDYMWQEMRLVVLMNKVLTREKVKKTQWESCLTEGSNASSGAQDQGPVLE